MNPRSPDGRLPRQTSSPTSCIPGGGAPWPALYTRVLPTLDAIPQCSWTREATRSRPSLARLELVMTYRSSRYASSSSPACNSAAARSRPSCWPSEKSAGVRAEKSQRDDQLIAFLRARSWEHKSAFAGHSQTFPRERRSISQNFVRASPKKGRTGLAPVREQRIPPLSAPSPAATPTVAEGEDGFSRSSSTPNCLWPGGIQCRSCRQRGLAPAESINARRVRLPINQERNKDRTREGNEEKKETKRLWLERQKERTKDRKKDRKKQRKTERKKERKDHIRRQDLAALNKTRHVLAKPSKAQQEATCSHLIRCFANGGGCASPQPPSSFCLGSF